jgi:hypothetical protein
MPVEMRMWRLDGQELRPLTAATLPTENELHQLLRRDPSLLGTPLLVIGSEVITPYGKRLDLLAIDADGNLHVLELKRDRTPREVVAQVLDYGSWVTTLSRDDVIDIARKELGQPFEAAFEEAFGVAPPDEINGELQLTVVASALDGSSERIVSYLRTFGVPINAVFFTYIEDDGRRYLARSWLAASDERAVARIPLRSGQRGTDSTGTSPSVVTAPGKTPADLASSRPAVASFTVRRSVRCRRALVYGFTFRKPVTSESARSSGPQLDSQTRA